MKKVITTHENKDLEKFFGKTKASNMVKSVVYRWIQTFERPITDERIKNQLDLLDDNVRVLTNVGFLSGKKELPNLLSILYTNPTNYLVEEINVFPCGVGLYTAQARLKYSGANADGEMKNLNIDFEADLIMVDELTYQFVRIKIITLEEIQNEVKDSYPINRASSLVHRCMGLISYNITEPKILNDYLLSNFNFYPLDREHIKENEKAIQWINEINNVLDNIILSPVNMNVRVNPDQSNEFYIEFDLLVEGTNAQGELKHSLSKNMWKVIDDPNQSFPKIKSIHVEKLEPLIV